MLLDQVNAPGLSAKNTIIVINLGKKPLLESPDRNMI